MKNKNNYCIYTDKFYEGTLSKEHIIPISLGGYNEFSIYSDEKMNNEIGSKIEGKFQNQDILGKFFRLANNNKGHSGKEFVAKIKSDDGKRTLQINKNNEISVFDNTIRKNIEIPIEDSFQGTIYRDLFIGLIAKIALGTGYYLFGDKFVRYSDCKSLREIINSVINDQEIKTSKYKIKLHYWYRDKVADFIDSIFKTLESSGVVIELCDDYINFYVGINGHYLGVIAIKCDIKRFTFQDHYNILIACKNKKVIKKDNAISIISNLICNNKFCSFNCNELNKKRINNILDIVD